eukprot:1142260-Pelagomonas_calceolata.AAC.11
MLIPVLLAEAVYGDLISIGLLLSCQARSILLQLQGHKPEPCTANANALGNFKSPATISQGGHTSIDSLPDILTLCIRKL